MKPHVYLSRPYAPKTVYRNRSFSVYGYLKTWHGAGAKSVKITAYRSGIGCVALRAQLQLQLATPSTDTRCGCRMPGRWKLVATTPADGYHAATTSSATYVTVK